MEIASAKEHHLQVVVLYQSRQRNAHYMRRGA